MLVAPLMTPIFGIALGLVRGGATLLRRAIRAEIAGVRFGHWVEGLILNRLPGYAAIKRLTRGLTNTDEKVKFIPALLINNDGDLDIVYLIEDRGDGMATVLLPWAPAPFAGSVKIIDRNRLQMMDANLSVK